MPLWYGNLLSGVSAQELLSFSSLGSKLPGNVSAGFLYEADHVLSPIADCLAIVRYLYLLIEGLEVQTDQSNYFYCFE